MKNKIQSALKAKKGIIKIIFLSCFIIIMFASCGGDHGELVGVQHRPKWYQSDPYGMVYIPAGSYNMGPSDEDVPYAVVSQSKTVTVPAFYMDHTEITNNQYRQFVYWVRDSLAHRLIGGDHILEEGEYGERINWKKKIKWDDEANTETLAELFLPESERYYRKKEIDTRKLMFDYYWIDLKSAAEKEMQDGKLWRPQGMTDRSVYIKKGTVNVYPDTLAWIHDYTYSFNDPLTRTYFWHPAYDEYPVVGVSWIQATAFCIWRTQYLHAYLNSMESTFPEDYRLPTESEWEYASRGGLQLSPYPWGGPYIRNSRGCFLANFKPMRGNYIDDGGVYTVKVTSYWPNDYGLYCMAGNVSEWTSNAFDESAYSFTHDLSPDYSYNAKDSDLPALKRKVIRGGSWKDVGYFLQTGSRSYEYQDTAKCYIGLRCVMSFLGRDKSDY